MVRGKPCFDHTRLAYVEEGCRAFFLRNYAQVRDAFDRIPTDLPPAILDDALRLYMGSIFASPVFTRISPGSYATHAPYHYRHPRELNE